MSYMIYLIFLIFLLFLLIFTNNTPECLESFNISMNNSCLNKADINCGSKPKGKECLDCFWDNNELKDCDDIMSDYCNLESLDLLDYYIFYTLHPDPIINIEQLANRNYSHNMIYTEDDEYFTGNPCIELSGLNKGRGNFYNTYNYFTRLMIPKKVIGFISASNTVDFGPRENDGVINKWWDNYEQLPDCGCVTAQKYFGRRPRSLKSSEDYISVNDQFIDAYKYNIKFDTIYLKSNKFADWDFYNVLDDHRKFKVGDDELIDKTYFNSNNPIFIKVTEGNYKIMPNFCSGKNTEIKENDLPCKCNTCNNNKICLPSYPSDSCRDNVNGKCYKFEDNNYIIDTTKKCVSEQILVPGGPPIEFYECTGPPTPTPPSTPSNACNGNVNGKCYEFDYTSNNYVIDTTKTCIAKFLLVPGGRPITFHECDNNTIWCGSAPFCNGKCPTGCTEIERGDYGDGSECLSGKKVKCDCTGITERRCG